MKGVKKCRLSTQKEQRSIEMDEAEKVTGNSPAELGNIGLQSVIMSRKTRKLAVNQNPCDNAKGVKKRHMSSQD